MWHRHSCLCRATAYRNCIPGWLTVGCRESRHRQECLVIWHGTDKRYELTFSLNLTRIPSSASA